MRFRPTDRVISERIDDEVMMIHLVSGNYYNLRGSGPAVWAELDAGRTADEIAERLVDGYDVSRDEAKAAVESVVDDLLAEDLIEAAASAAAEASSPAEAVDGKARLPFAPPTLEKHTDMQDLILLDPVHEVDARGWPYAAASPDEAA